MCRAAEHIVLRSRCPRPLGVAVYGHPRRPLSSYELHLVYRQPDYLDQFTLHPANETEDELEERAGGRQGAGEVGRAISEFSVFSCFPLRSSTILYFIKEDINS